MTGPNRWTGIVSTAGLGVLFAAAIADQAVALAGSWGVASWRLGGPAAVVVCVLALLRHRHPAWTAAGGLAVAAVAIVVARLAGLPAEPGPPMTLGLMVLTGTAVRVLPAAQAGAIAAAGLALVTGRLVVDPPDGTGGVSAVAVLSAAALAAAVVVGRSLRTLDARAATTAERVRREERLELARELHDIVAHHITGMVIQAQAAQIVARRDPADAAEPLAGIEAAGTEALAAMRRVVGLLRDTGDAPPVSPGPERLDELVKRFGTRGPKARLHAAGGEDWPPEVTSTVYRIVREALTNVRRHAPQAGSVTVTVAEEAGEVTVQVDDDAPPGPARPHHRAGYGLVGMRERVETLGGALTAGPRPGGGWTVRAVLPLTESR
ncbi:sensor histidine kinase [Actinomadura opuntiae]|uniref:sensor histidine kinase n=1 Tax=Actinomadura sp. OS1-43 TaxID=604315 RepID=UPI00255ADFA3|nr:histidine kinase [Actinomadura sp. OS1-43]MDL4816279.1 histidine kinase [Actinomadura sp. OS1-43]